MAMHRGRRLDKTRMVHRGVLIHKCKVLSGTDIGNCISSSNVSTRRYTVRNARSILHSLQYAIFEARDK